MMLTSIFIDLTTMNQLNQVDSLANLEPSMGFNFPN